jgi:hypothetical protein
MPILGYLMQDLVIELDLKDLNIDNTKSLENIIE